MVIFLEENKRPTTSQRFSQAFSRAGQAAGQEIPNYLSQQREAKAKRDFAKELGVDLHGSEDDEFTNSILENAMKERAEYARNEYKSQEKEKLKHIFMQQGVSEQDADLYANLTVGGQTEYVKKLIEKRRREQGASSDNLEQEKDVNEVENQPEEPNIPEKLSAKKTVKSELSNYLSNQYKDMLPSDKLKRQSERYKTGFVEYDNARKKIENLRGDSDRINSMQKISKDLPKNFERLNVDSEGNLRVPFLSSPSVQTYIKLLNEFSVSAKDSFGSRVTNFDLSQFMKRFPGLLNTEQGRKQVLERMKIVNEINAVYYKNLKEIYNRAGGVRNIDADVAQKFAEDLSEEKVSELRKKFDTIGEFSSKPEASEFKGKKIKDKNTGEVFISNGEEWVPEEKNGL